MMQYRETAYSQLPLISPPSVVAKSGDIQSTLAYGTSTYGKSTVMVTLRVFGPTFMAIY